MALLNWAFVFSIISLSYVTHGLPTSGSETSERSDSPAHIFRRQLPAFVDWPTDGPGNTKKDALTQAFRDMVTVVNQVLNSDAATYNTIFDKYFLPEHKDAVKTVFQNMIAPATNDPSTGADILSTIDLHPDDYQPTMVKQCSGLNPNKRPIAYTNNPDDKQPQTWMHFCDTAALNAYAYPKLADLNCGTLDLFVSYKMLSLGGYVVLHELAHVNKISQAAITPFKQRGNEVGDYKYGPWYTKELRATTEFSSLTIGNADNYAWFANEVYWSNVCGHGFASAKDNNYYPPGACNILKGKRDDPTAVTDGDCLGH